MSLTHWRRQCVIYVCMCVQENGRPRFTPADLSAHLSPLFENLFLAFQKPESAENEYLMKCVMRVITFVGTDVRPSYPLCIAASTVSASWRLTLLGLHTLHVTPSYLLLHAGSFTRELFSRSKY